MGYKASQYANRGGPINSIPASILVISYFGDIVFAVSGALVAARKRMDLIGFLLVGTVTGIGGGTIRDLLLGRTVWWTQDLFELLLCAAAALVTYFLVRSDVNDSRWMTWADALGLSAFCVVGCHIALEFGTLFLVAVLMGVVTATGGGMLRDILTQQQPLILQGELYATAALIGSLSYAVLSQYTSVSGIAALAAFLIAFGVRGLAIVYHLRLGPPGGFIRADANQE